MSASVLYAVAYAGMALLVICALVVQTLNTFADAAIRYGEEQAQRELARLRQKFS